MRIVWVIVCDTPPRSSVCAASSTAAPVDCVVRRENTPPQFPRRGPSRGVSASGEGDSPCPATCKPPSERKPDQQRDASADDAVADQRALHFRQHRIIEVAGAEVDRTKAPFAVVA